MATGGLSSSRPKAAPISTLVTWRITAFTISDPSSCQVPAPPMAEATSVPTAARARLASTEASAATMTATSLAVTTRSRRGTRAYVVRAVRCDHSLVIERMPSTGNSTPTGSSEGTKKLENVWSASSA